MIRNYRKPVIVVGPKVLLRLPAAASTLDEMAPGTSFRTVIGDEAATNPSKVEKVVFVTGKHYYPLVKAAEERGLREKVAIVRVEQLCPFPTMELQEELKKYKSAKGRNISPSRNSLATIFSNCSVRLVDRPGKKAGYFPELLRAWSMSDLRCIANFGIRTLFDEKHWPITRMA